VEEQEKKEKNYLMSIDAKILNKMASKSNSTAH
jgi:hypothetical protein